MKLSVWRGCRVLLLLSRRRFSSRMDANCKCWSLILLHSTMVIALDMQTNIKYCIWLPDNGCFFPFSLTSPSSYTTFLSLSLFIWLAIRSHDKYLTVICPYFIYNLKSTYRSFCELYGISTFFPWWCSFSHLPLSLDIPSRVFHLVSSPRRAVESGMDISQCGFLTSSFRRQHRIRLKILKLFLSCFFCFLSFSTVKEKTHPYIYKGGKLFPFFRVGCEY